jgi:hypothetical protein
VILGETTARGVAAIWVVVAAIAAFAFHYIVPILRLLGVPDDEWERIKARLKVILGTILSVALVAAVGFGLWWAWSIRRPEPKHTSTSQPIPASPPVTAMPTIGAVAVTTAVAASPATAQVVAAPPTTTGAPLAAPPWPVTQPEAYDLIDRYLKAADRAGDEMTAWAMLTLTEQQHTYGTDPVAGFDRFRTFWTRRVQHVELDVVNAVPSTAGTTAAMFDAIIVYVIYVDGGGQGPSCRQRQRDTFGLVRQPDGRILIDSYGFAIVDSC